MKRRQDSSVRRTRDFRLASLLLALMFAAPVFAATPGITAPPATALTLGGEVGRPLTLDASALAKMPHVDVQASVHGVADTWSGVPLHALLQAAGVPLGESMHGKNLALYVRITAADGYRVVYALAELDPQFRNEPVILADHHDGKPLDAKEGPLRIIAPTDLRPARWIRQVTRIDVLNAADAGH